jgi:hypothetical protein
MKRHFSQRVDIALRCERFCNNPLNQAELAINREVRLELIILKVMSRGFAFLGFPKPVDAGKHSNPVVSSLVHLVIVRRFLCFREKDDAAILPSRPIRNINY